VAPGAAERPGPRPAGRPRPRPGRRAAALEVLALVALALLSGARRGTAAAGPDTLRLHVEVGASSDYTNELFYEDTFDSTAFTGREQVDSPETRYAGVLFTRLTGTLGRRATGFEVQNELSIGDLLSRDLLLVSLRSAPGPRWTLLALPQAEYRRDRTFGRDLEEWRGSATVRARRALDDGETFAEIGAHGDLLTASGVGAEYILDRTAGAALAAIERAPLFGLQWRLDYAFTGRVFTDSTERNHYEHTLDGQMRFDLPGGRPLIVEAGGDRRTTMEPAITTRDNFWDERAAIDGEIGIGGAWSLKGRIEGDATQYDAPDSTIYFDYQELRARITPRWTRGTMGIGVGPRLDALFSRLDPTESYREIAALVEFESLGLGAWWNVIPVAGWRDYDEAPEATIGIHSSYSFAEINLLADQTLPGALRLRAYVNGRLESHVDHSQDARSLYFSLDLRRLF
jgi:hypothetical protein